VKETSRAFVSIMEGMLLSASQSSWPGRYRLV
jgi:hypothetical protein